MARISLPEAQPNSPRVRYVPRQGPVLHPTPLTGSADAPGLNLTRGCALGCAFCSVRASPGQPEDGGILFFTRTAEALDAELTASHPRPRAVFLSPGVDPFPDIPEVQKEVGRVVEVLAGHGVDAWLMTRGRIQQPALPVLAKHRERVRVTVPITTLDEGLHAILEPGALAPAGRLEQIALLRELGICVQVAIDPLIPGLTDSKESLADLLSAVKEAGIDQVTVSYLFLREKIGSQLRTELGERAGEVVRAFTGGPLLSGNGLAAARYLPRARRQRGYATLMALAAGLGMSVSVSGLTNPDFQPTRVEAPEPRRSLVSRFLESGGCAEVGRR